MKKCCTCLRELELTFFHKNRSEKDGLHRECKICRQAVSKRYLSNNKDKVHLQNKIYRTNNKQKVAAIKKSWCIKNANYIKEKSRERFQRNKDRLQEINKNNSKRLYYSSINFRLSKVIRARLITAIKNGKALKYLGCSIDELKAHLESKFQPGMTWDNWSKNGWHIDHIIPLSSFDLTNPDELKKACHFSNLQPLWAKDNLEKSNKLSNNHYSINDL